MPGVLRIHLSKVMQGTMRTPLFAIELLTTAERRAFAMPRAVVYVLTFDRSAANVLPAGEPSPRASLAKVETMHVDRQSPLRFGASTVGIYDHRPQDRGLFLPLDADARNVGDR